MRSEVRELREAALGGLAADAGIDLVAAAGLPASAIPLLAGLRKRLMLPLLWVGGAPEAEGPMREIAVNARQTTFCVEWRGGAGETSGSGGTAGGSAATKLRGRRRRRRLRERRSSNRQV